MKKLNKTFKAMAEAQSKMNESTKNLKPSKEKLGWNTQNGFEDEPSGWMLEGGEQAYNEAIKEWENLTNL